MRVILKIVSGIGFTMVLMGVGCVESESVLLPIAMIAFGAVLIAVSAGLEANYSTEERNVRDGQKKSS